MPLTKTTADKTNPTAISESGKNAKLAGQAVLRVNILSTIYQTPTLPGAAGLAKKAIITGNTLSTETPDTNSIIATGLGTAAQLGATSAIMAPLVGAVATVTATLPAAPALVLGAAVLIIGSKVADANQPINDAVTQLTYDALCELPQAARNAEHIDSRMMTAPAVSSPSGKTASFFDKQREKLTINKTTRQSRAASHSSSTTRSTEASSSYFADTRQKLGSLCDFTAPPRTSTLSPARDFVSKPSGFFEKAERNFYGLEPAAKPTKSSPTSTETSDKDFSSERSPNERSCSLSGGCTW